MRLSSSRSLFIRALASLTVALLPLSALAQSMRKADDDTVNKELGGAAPGSAAPGTAEFVGTKQSSERREQAIAPIQDAPGLPRVLLIGDSISIGYTLATREELKGKANVHRPPVNCGGTRFARTQIDKWLGDGRWDVIHYNSGLHDMRIIERTNQPLTAEQYAANLRALIDKLQSKATKVIWATTTPLARGSARQEDLNKLNEVGLQVAKEKGLPVDDLFALAKAKQAQIQLPGDAHYSVEGYAVLAQAVAASIEKELPAKQK